MEYDELRKHLRIDLTALHKSAQEQPGLALEAGELAAELKAAARRCKLDLDEAKGNAYREIRNNPDQFGLDKITESAISSTIPVHPAVVAAAREEANAYEAADKAAALADAFGHRKSMIQDEVRLFLGNYWGDIEIKDMGGAAADVKATKGDIVEGKRRHRRGAADVA